MVLKIFGPKLFSSSGHCPLGRSLCTFSGIFSSIEFFCTHFDGPETIGPKFQAGRVIVDWVALCVIVWKISSQYNLFTSSKKKIFCFGCRL